MTAPSTMPAFSVEAVACEAVSAVRGAMGDAREWGLADYPRHLNVGDSAIWLGERQLLRTAGVRVVASCDTATYSRRAFGRALAGRPVLLHGGGSFGDLWPEHQLLRERILADFPGRPVVQLGQSINFRSAENLERARRAVARHGNVTLVVRDAPSRDRATELFDARVVLAPDMAFALGRLERTASATQPLLHLGRDDLERSEGALLVADHVDWIIRRASRATVLRSRSPARSSCSRRAGPGPGARAPRRGPSCTPTTCWPGRTSTVDGGCSRGGASS